MRQERDPNAPADFRRDLRHGQEYEKHIATLLHAQLGASTRDSGDLTVMTAGGATDCEVKFDERYDETGNVALEILDVFDDRMRGTGFGKQCGIGIPSFNVHALGTTGDVLVYQAIDVFE
jgi:hypothetical protein